MSFLVPVADSHHWLFLLGELVASSIQGTVLIIGWPGDILQAAAGGNAMLPAGSQHELDAESQGEWMPGLVCASKQLIPLPPVLCTSLDRGRIISYLLCSLLLPLPVILKVNIFSLLALLSGECHHSWHASRQMGTFLLLVLSISIRKRVAKHLWMLDKMILDRACFVQHGEWMEIIF